MGQNRLSDPTFGKLVRRPGYMGLGRTPGSAGIIRVVLVLGSVFTAYSPASGFSNLAETTSIIGSSTHQGSDSPDTSNILPGLEYNQLRLQPSRRPERIEYLLCLGETGRTSANHGDSGNRHGICCIGDKEGNSIEYLNISKSAQDGIADRHVRHGVIAG